MIIVVSLHIIIHLAVMFQKCNTKLVDQSFAAMKITKNF